MRRKLILGVLFFGTEVVFSARWLKRSISTVFFETEVVFLARWCQTVAFSDRFSSNGRAGPVLSQKWLVLSHLFLNSLIYKPFWDWPISEIDQSWPILVFTKEWTQILNELWTPSPPRPDGKKVHQMDAREQAVSLIRVIWNIFEAQWKCRNKILHWDESKTWLGKS